MVEQNKQQKSGAEKVIETGAQAAQAVRGAAKVGKAAAGVAKGAAAGGPYGAAAMAVWENRKFIGKVIAAIAALLMIPILFIMMLPALIFGTLDTDDYDYNADIMNDNSAIMANIEKVDTAVRDILVSSHDGVIAQINGEIEKLDEGILHVLNDPYVTELTYNCSMLISEYCASKNNYTEINIDDLKKTIGRHKDQLFGYTSETTTQTVVNADKSETVITTVTYTVSFVGEAYFADNVFYLNDEQKITAAEYAENLAMFINENKTK